MSILEEEDGIQFLHGTLKIHVIEAKDLPDTDSTFFNIDRGDKTDAFVTIKLGDVELLKTAYIPNNLDPRWDELFSIPVCHRASSLVVLVRDREHVGFQSVGSFSILVDDLISGEPIESWFDLMVGADGSIHGSVHLMLQYFPVGTLPQYGDNVLQDGYFEPKGGNQVTLYMTADTPQLPVFEGVTEPDGSQYQTTRCWLDLYLALEQAEKFIYVAGWSVFTAISLVRGEEAANYPDTNLGELLKRKAADGVKVLVMTWNEKSNDGGLLEGLMGTHDEETFGYFMGTDVICANVPRAKKSWLGLGGQFVGGMYTHHQKTIICDADNGDGLRRLVAFLGGIDVTDGRYDNPEFNLFSTIRTLHAGDYYQNCTLGGNEETGPREPWQDIHAKIEGPAAEDVYYNFADRWCQQNLRQREDLYWLSEDEFDVQSCGPVKESQGGPFTIQLFRSITSDSAVMDPDRIHCLHRKYGRLVENSIHLQYINLIRNAQSYIYIENQYFLGSAFAWLADQDVLSHHNVPIEIAEKIISKIRSDEMFHVYITIPMYPEGDPASVASQEILRWQFRTMEMMYKRIGRELEKWGSDKHPSDYLSFYCLGKRESPDELPDDLLDPEPGTGAELTRISLRHPIYVHSKLMIVDDEYIILGSANINGRSLYGNRDTEICFGGFQPDHRWNGEESPRGAVHSFRVALWSAHLGGYNSQLENPGTQECLEYVKEVSTDFWCLYCAEEASHSDVHLMPYPLRISQSGDLLPLEGPWDCFPDTLAPVVGARSSMLPVKLTT